MNMHEKITDLIIHIYSWRVPIQQVAHLAVSYNRKKELKKNKHRISPHLS